MRRNDATDAVKAFHEGDAAGYLAARYGEGTVVQLSYLVRRNLATQMLDAVRGDILDVGCGPGPFIGDMQRESRRLFMADLAQNMLREAREAAGAVREVQWITSDVTRLPFRGESFDGVLCIGVIGYVPEPAVAMGEIRRVLRPGGTGVIQVSNLTGLKHQVYEEWLPWLKGLLGRCSGTGRGFGGKLFAAPKGRFDRLLKGAGLELVDWAFYDFHVPFVERFGQRRAVALAQWLQLRLARSRWGRWLGSGYLAKVRRSDG